MIVETPRYRLALSDDWVEEPHATNVHKAFTSAPRACVLSIVSQEVTDGTSKDTVRAAQYVLAMRLDAETKISEANKNPIEISEPKLVAQPWGASVAYYGHDANGRQFQYSAAVWPRQILTLFVESNRLTQQELAAVMAEVLGGVEFNGNAV